ncbi:MAG: terminase family protein [Vannielia sp.]|uniref:hypothetical protein n=1 Tax=Vannielia sp. TaxID=2813045 RepID=UPI003B8BA5F3
MAAKAFSYIPDGKILGQFFRSDASVQIIQGPVGSGTSTACCFKLWRMACEQRPDAQGIRRTRWVIVRNTFNDLKETTLKTWKYWFEQVAMGAFGEVKMTNPPHHDIGWTLRDGTQVQAEFIFLALDQEDDVRKLLSMEMTGIWFNEAQFTEKAIFDAAHSRAAQGRYPPKLDGGPTWKGVICDLNAPPEGHWIPYMRGDVPMPEEWTDEERRAFQKPEGWEFFLQPAGLIEEIVDGRVAGYLENNAENRERLALDPVDEVAENMKWIDVSYLELISAKNKSWIDTYVMNRVGLYRAGQPVYTGFREEIHVAKEPIEYNPNLPLIVGLDFARNPAMICIQVLRGRVFVLDEYGVKNENATKYAPLFKQRLARKFPLAMARGGKGIQFWGDPTGGSKGQGTDQTPFSIFASNGMKVAPAPGNNSITLRISAVQAQIDKMVDGAPALLVDQDCITLKGGFAGGYHYARIKGTSAFHEEPNKRVTYADYHDALQYACLGAGTGISAVHGTGIPKPTKMRERKKFSLAHR